MKPNSYISIAVVAGAILTIVLLHRLWQRNYGIVDLRGQLPKHPTRQFPRRSLSAIEQIVVHHSAGNSQETVESVNRYHIGPNHVCDSGCPGVLYTLMVDRKGVLYPLHDFEVITYHIQDQNTKSLGICVLGNFEQEEPSAVQLKALQRGISYVQQRLGRKIPVTTHGTTCTACNTDCPGTNLERKIIYA